MIKGWRNNPHWCSFYASRVESAEGARQLRGIAEVQKRGGEVQQKVAEDMAKFRQEQREHMAKCHADKLAKGEIIEDHSKLN